MNALRATKPNARDYTPYPLEYNYAALKLAIEGVVDSDRVVKILLKQFPNGEHKVIDLSKAGRRIYSPNDLIKMRKLVDEGLKYREVAERMGIVGNGANKVFQALLRANMLPGRSRGKPRGR